MAKENVSVVETTQNATELKLYVEREKFKGKEDGKEYWSYLVRGKVRGRDIKVGLIPPDKGGYEVLDIVFGNATTAELVLAPFEFEDDNGKKVSGMGYEVRNIEDGVEYKSKIKPARASDKSLLDMLLNQINKN